MASSTVTNEDNFISYEKPKCKQENSCKSRQSDTQVRLELQFVYMYSYVHPNPRVHLKRK